MDLDNRVLGWETLFVHVLVSLFICLSLLLLGVGVFPFFSFFFFLFFCFCFFFQYGCKLSDMRFSFSTVYVEHGAASGMETVSLSILQHATTFYYMLSHF